jgi:nicotinamidase-related amidase
VILDRDRSQLLIVDVQERLLPAMHEGERMIEQCGILLQTAAELGVPVTLSEQYRKGLGPTVERLDNLKGDAVVMEKQHFSCAADTTMLAHIADQADDGRRQLVIAGIESHVCVLQSALGFRQGGLDVFVVMDAVTSRKQESVDLARDRFLSNRIAAVNTEMVAFEWLQVSGTPEFKTISKLIK